MNSHYSLQLRDFEIRFSNGQSRNDPIESISELDEIIRIYGRGIIAKITFYFHDSSHKFHSLILQNSENNDRFVVEFYHYYNNEFQRVELSREQQESDFVTVLDCLKKCRNLNSQLEPFIIKPF
jgi:hypothetical protein